MLPPRPKGRGLRKSKTMTRRYYAVLTRMDMLIIPYHVHAFDSAARRDAWCAGPVPRGFDAQPATAHAALRDIRADMHLDGVWGATVDEYLERHPERWHDGAHDATMTDAAAGLHVWWRWCEVNRWEHETWAVYTPLDDPADAELAVRLGGEASGAEAVLRRPGQDVHRLLRPPAEWGARGYRLGAADVHGRHGRWTEGAHAPRHRGADMAGVP